MDLSDIKSYRMFFFKHRLEFEAKRRFTVNCSRVELESAGELRRREAEDKASSPSQTSGSELVKEDSWEPAKLDVASCPRKNQRIEGCIPIPS